MQISFLKTEEKMICVCSQCCTSFELTKKRVQDNLRKNKNGPFCGKICADLNQNKKLHLVCTNCSKHIKKSQSQFKKSLNHFCTKSCAATYNNKHKTHGTRRSKLEIYLEEQIRIDYPNINMVCNQKDVINSELDFYFPDLKLAIELNGIFHYEPIYGEERLSQIQNNDNRKFQACLERGIELCIIDSSKCTYLKQSTKDKFYNIVKNILDFKNGRQGGT